MNFREEVAAFVSSLPKGNVTWKNLNPTAVMSEVGNLFDLGPIGNFFDRVCNFLACKNFYHNS